MFKPSLKRSKLQSLSKSTINTNFNTINTYYNRSNNAKNQSISIQQQYSYLDNRSLQLPFQSKLQQKLKSNNQYIFNPLNYSWHQYPSNIHQSLQESSNNSSNRAIGMYKDILWYFHENKMIIYNVKTQTENTFMIPQGSNIVSVGQIQNSSLFFRTNGLYIVAIGISNANNNLLLFGIDRITLKKSQFKQNFTIANSRYIQKIKFLNNSQLIICSDTSQIYHFDFVQQFKISHIRNGLLKSILPVWPLLYPKNEKIQDIQLCNNKIYLLINQQRQLGILSKAKHKLSSFLSSQRPYKNTYELKRIQIYNLNRYKSQIRLQLVIQQRQFISRLKNKYVELNDLLKQDIDALKIVSIYKSNYNNTDTLSIVIRCGYFITINYQKDKEYVILDMYITKKDNSIGSVGFGIKKYQPKIEQKSRINKVSLSLGIKNLSLMNQAIWYIDQDRVQVVKYQGMIGQIQQVVMNDLQQRKWVIFKQKGYFIIQRLTNASIFLGHLLYRNKTIKNHSQISYKIRQSFQIFVDNFSQVIGYDKICQMLIQSLIDENKDIHINEWLFQMMGQSLKGSPNKHYRDWHYQLKEIRQQQQTKEINKQIKDDLWAYLIKYQYKKVKYDGSNNLNIAYCNAIRSIYYKLTQSLLFLRPSTIKSKKTTIQSHFKMFQKLNKFIVFKKQYQNNQSRSGFIHQNYKYQNKYMKSYQNQYNYQQFNKNNEQQSTQATFDSSFQVQSNKNIESITHNEQIFIKSLQRIRSLIYVFMHLSDLGQNQKLPNLMNVLKSKRERIKVKRYLVERVNNKEQLLNLAELCPDFEIQKYVRYKEWYDQQSKFKNLDLLNLKQLASLINSSYISDLKVIFQGRQDLFIPLIIFYMDYIRLQLENVQRRRNIMNDKRNIRQFNILSVQNKDMSYIDDNNQKTTSLDQQTNILQEQYKFMQEQQKKLVSSFVQKCMKSDGTNFKPKQLKLHEIIRITALYYNHQSIYSHLQAELRKNGFIEQIILLTKITKKPKQKPNFSTLFENNDNMNTSSTRQQRIPQQRLSNLQKILYNFDMKTIQ